MKNLKNTIFVHYGTNKIKENLFKVIKNRRGWNKPQGGIWASPLNSNHSWRRFCLDENFNIGTLKKHILFKINSNSKIYIINSYLDLIKLKKYFIFNVDRIFNEIMIDYEKMMKDGYDGIYLTEDGEHDTRFSPYGRYGYDCSMNGKLDLYGWDCESIVIFNKSIIKQAKRKRLKLSKRNYKKQSIVIYTQKSNNIDNPDILEWDRNKLMNNTILIPGKNYRSKKAYYRNIEKVLYETEDDPSRIIKLY